MTDSAPADVRLPKHPCIQHDVSCTIIAFNEQDRIQRCIESVQGIAREIVVVDSGSTDATCELCRSLGARVIHNPWPGYGPQKRFAEDVASYDWVLNLDADEWLSDEARTELISILSQPISPETYGFRFKIKTVYPGDSRPRFWADYHNYVRMYNKKQCRFPKSMVHDEIKLRGRRCIQIKSPIYHNTIRSISHLIEKNIKYFELQRKEIPKNKFLVLTRMPFETFAAFAKYYVIKRHLTGGVYGLVFASTMAYLRMVRLVILGFGGQDRKPHSNDGK